MKPQRLIGEFHYRLEKYPVNPNICPMPLPITMMLTEMPDGPQEYRHNLLHLQYLTLPIWIIFLAIQEH